MGSWRFLRWSLWLLLVIFSLGPKGLWADDEPVRSSELHAPSVDLLRRFFLNEEQISQQIQTITGSKGELERIKSELAVLDKKRRKHELLIKWAIICPSSFVINVLLASSELANAFPPASTGLSAAIGTFGMLFAFDFTDKYWNKYFNEDLQNAVEEFRARSAELIRLGEIDFVEGQEVDLKNLDLAVLMIERSEAREIQLAGIRDEILGAASKNDLKSQTLKWRLEQAYQDARLSLLQQRLKLVVSLRSKISYGDNRFKGKDRRACIEVLDELAKVKLATES